VVGTFRESVRGVFQGGVRIAVKIIIFLLVGVLALVALMVVASLLACAAATLYALLPFPKVPFRYNVRNLQVRWKTTVVTAVAFTLVVALLVGMLAFVKGMYRLTQSSGQPGNIIVLSDGATDEAFSSLPFGVDVLRLPKNVQDMVQKDGDKFWAVREVYVVVNQEMPLAGGGLKRRFVQMRGVDDVELAARIHGIELQEGGTWFSGKTYEVVLGDGVARTFGADMGKDSVGPGDTIRLGPKEWCVAGVMKASGSTFGSEVWARDIHVQESFGRKTQQGNSYSSFVVRVKDPEAAAKAAEFIQNERGQEPFAAMTETEYYSKLSQTNQQFLVAALIVAIVMAVGGVLGVMNTMFAAISQRAKDIGVMRLLGYTRWQILSSFLLESLIIALIGGILGCALGSVTHGWSATSIVSSGAGGGGKSVALKLVVDAQVLLAGMGLTVIMGAVGGLAPSLSAMRLRPLESLR
jgi:putative ABC transport system permease protein